ncbi:HmuY family protein [Pelobium manganitolerans]|uniref:HmuY family protein n=1 Tax=Pelobium manganitolerans TaxID=1842495 RepID=UPI003FA3BAD1
MEKFGRSLMMITLCLSTVLYSCKKDEQQKSLEDGKSTVVYDLAGDTNAAMGSTGEGKEQKPFRAFLFRFADKQQIWLKNAADSAKYLKSNDWDIAFTGPYNSEIFVNNGSKNGNPGYGGTANGQIIKLDQAYETLDQAPADSEFANSTLNKIGWASNDDSAGWFTYSLNLHMMNAIKNRVYAIKLPNGKYAKLEIINAYKGNPPSITEAYWPAPYYTFRYYVQADGSHNLKTR